MTVGREGRDTRAKGGRRTAELVLDVLDVDVRVDEACRVLALMHTRRRRR